MLYLTVSAYTLLVAVMTLRNPDFPNCIADDDEGCIFMLPTGDKLYFTYDAEFFIPGNYGTTDITKQWLDKHAIPYEEKG